MCAKEKCFHPPQEFRIVCRKFQFIGKSWKGRKTVFPACLSSAPPQSALFDCRSALFNCTIFMFSTKTCHLVSLSVVTSPLLISKNCAHTFTQKNATVKNSQENNLLQQQAYCWWYRPRGIHPFTKVMRLNAVPSSAL